MSMAGIVRTHKPRLFHPAILAVPWLALAGAAYGQTFTVLHNFSGGPSDGFEPVGELIQSGNTLYGMTEGGGSTAPGGDQGDGAVFALNIGNDALTLLHSFTGGSTDGASPLGSLLLSGNNLYGTTFGGGIDGNANTTQGNGTVFAVNTTNNSETVLHFFAGAPTDGLNPSGALIESGSTLYGLADGPNSVNQAGTLFALNPSNNTLSVLHTFAGGTADGAHPQGSLVQSGNIFYGLTSEGGGNGNSGFGYGTLFAFNTTNNTETVLHSFAGGSGDGGLPNPTLIQSGKMLYGTTYEGGANNFGTIFAFDTTTDIETVLYSFTSTNGVNGQPDDGLVQLGSILYGVNDGGTINRGEIYAFDTATDSYTILHMFSGPDGRIPNDLLLSGNTLYGTTAIGGSKSAGVIFSLTIPEPTSASLLAFSAVALLARRRRQRH